MKGLIALLSATLIGLLYFSTGPGRALIYQESEAISSVQVVHALSKTDKRMDHRPFQLLYPKDQKTFADTTLTIAEQVLPRIESDLGYTVQKTIPIIVLDSPIRLDVSLGWPQSFRAEGAYDRSVVYLVAPGSSSAALSDYIHSGPVAHELTHFVLDQQTHGNYPSWYTEGLAQLEDYRITGYAWITPQNNLRTHHLYSLSALSGNFYALHNQALAYREALSLVSYMAQVAGPAGLQKLGKTLAGGTPFPIGVKKVFGMSLSRLFRSWLHWKNEHAAH